MSANVAVNYLWAAWYVTWILAVVWSARTKTQMKTDMAGAHRYASALGALFLFAPSHVPALAAGDPYHFATRRLWPVGEARDWTLFAIVVLAFGFCWWARLHLGRLWSGFVTLKDDHRVVDTGPYGLVRHPIYSGLMGAAAATALIRATPSGLLGFCLILIGFALTARIEERFLRQQLGARAYDDYSGRVAMLIPGLG